MDPAADHMNHYPHQTNQMDLLPNGAAMQNDMGMTMGGMQHNHHGANHMNHGGHHMGSGGGDVSGMMKMYFHYGLGDLVLFRGLVIDSSTTLMITCLVLFLSSILLEFIDYSRGYLSCRCRAMANSLNQGKSTSESRLVDQRDREQNWSCCAGSGGMREVERDQHGNQARRRTNESSGTYQYEARFFPVRSPDPQIYRLLQACLQFIRTGLSLALMLVAMTYNVCLIFPILLGSAVGYFIFYRPALDSKSVVCH